MNRSLPLMLALAGSALYASAADFKDPEFYSNTAIQCMSPNGQWAVSEIYGTVTLININNGDNFIFEAGETGSPYYMLGLGNVLTDDGLLLCVTDLSSSKASYYENGEWKSLDTGNIQSGNSSANGITPDGKRICGNLGLISTTLDDVTMAVPAIWDRQADGSYGNYVLLPHPELDFTGRAPQYITAVAISDDGHTVVGQIVDCRGAFLYPIVYVEDADGKWSYTLPTDHLMNPDDVKLPENPGESPKMPQPADYLSPEQSDAYTQAYNEWVASGYVQDLYPDAMDFMTDEKRAEYEADTAAYDTALAAWYEKYSAFDQAYWDIVSTSPHFQFNQIALSPDGKFFAMTNAVEDDSDPTSWMPVTINHVWEFEIGSEKITKYEDIALSVKAYGDNCILAVETDASTNCFNGYLLQDGKATSLYDFLCAKGEKIKEWVDLNMTHDTEVYDWENDVVSVQSLTFTGLPVASRDMSVIASWTQSVWGDYSPESYLFDFRDPSGIKTVATGANSDKNVSIGPDGNLHVADGVTKLTVYGLGGECLMQQDKPGSTVECGLASGVYIVRTDNADGSCSVVKVIK